MADAPPILPTTALAQEVLRAVVAALDRGARVILASVIARHGSAPSSPGQKLALFDDRTALGTIGGGAIERVALERMLAALDDPEATSCVETFRLGPSLGMCCGGSVDLLIEPIDPLIHVLVVGAGHVGVFTAPLLAAAGFRVTLCDARESAADPARLASLPSEAAGESAIAAEAVRVVHAEHDDPEVVRGLPADLARSAMLVMSHDHQLDQAVIEWAIERGFGFVGGVGSRAKAARTRARLEAKGVAFADVARVRMPVGADIGARSPAELGIAIAAELVAWRAQKLHAKKSKAAETIEVSA